jgi:TonB family protein
VSVGAHVLLLAIGLLLPETSRVRAMAERPVPVVFLMPEPPRSNPLPPPPIPRVEPRPVPVPRVEPPKPAPPAPEPPAPEPPAPEPPKPAPPAPPKPRPVVRTNVFGGSPDAPAAITSPTSKVVVAAAGFDGGAPSGGSGQGAARPGGVVAANFDGPASGAGSPAATRGTVRSGGFDAAPAPSREPRRARERVSEKIDTDVEILEKPRPDYTDEARRLRIEGDVVLRVTFGASGTMVVHGVLEGLGHGLDDAAIVAAKKIKFKPARRNGEPVDLTATLRVVFRLA